MEVINLVTWPCTTLKGVNISVHFMSYKTNVKNAHCAMSPKLAVVCDVYVNGTATVADPDDTLSRRGCYRYRVCQLFLLLLLM